MEILIIKYFYDEAALSMKRLLQFIKLMYRKYKSYNSKEETVVEMITSIFLRMHI